MSCLSIVVDVRRASCEVSLVVMSSRGVSSSSLIGRMKGGEGVFKEQLLEAIWRRCSAARRQEL